MKPIAVIHEDRLILKLLIVSGVVTDEKLAQARQIVRRFSDYTALTGKRKRTKRRGGKP